MGAMESSLSLPLAKAYAEADLRPRKTVTLQVRVRIPKMKQGLWVGSSGAITQAGFESYNRYPVDRLRAAT